MEENIESIQIKLKQYQRGIRCPNCGSLHNYIRVRTGELVCHKCGVITPKDQINS